MSYFCRSIADQQHVKSGKSRLLRFFFFFSEFIICKHLFFERIIWPPHGAYVMENLNTGQAVLESLNAPGFRGIAQGMLKYRDHQSSWSAHYVDFRNRKSVFLCYYQTATRNFYHCTERKRFYMAILQSFEVALMSVPAWIWIGHWERFPCVIFTCSWKFYFLTVVATDAKCFFYII